MTEQNNWITLQDRFQGLHGLSYVAREFADMILRRTVKSLGQNSVPACDQKALWLLGAMTCAAMENSNSCLLLQNEEETKRFTKESGDFMQIPLWADSEATENQRPADFQTIYLRWQKIVKSYPQTICNEAVSSDAKAPLQLVCADGKSFLYLKRYRIAEKSLAHNFGTWMKAKKDGGPQVSADAIANSCTLFKNPPENQKENHQLQAVIKALQTPFFVVTGGPGTGKTTVLTVILAWKLKQNPQWGKIALCAPTGKASKRMKEAVLEGVNTLQGEIDNEIKDKLREIPESTLHSLLGIDGSTGEAKRNQKNPIDADLVVVDECSMCDLNLMYRLFQALKPETHLILLGDADQLASVENGTILADLCRWLQKKGKTDFYERLEICHRFPADSPLSCFVREVIKDGGSPNYAELYRGTRFQSANSLSCLFLGIESETATKREELQRQLQNDSICKSQAMTASPNASNESFALPEMLKMLLEACGVPWASWKKPEADTQKWTEREWVAFYYNRAESVKLLCALHKGKWGVESLNSAMQICLGISDKKNGMPIMIARNDRTTNLRNGDVGVFYDKKIWFPLGESTEIPELDEETKKLLGKYARVSFVSYEEVQLPEHENAFAMTIHKSQGSGYDNVFLFLPEKDNPILTRELVYTGITRTQRNCIVIAPRTILEEAVKRKTSRWTGLDTLLDSSMECKDEGGEEAVQSAP